MNIFYQQNSYIYYKVVPMIDSDNLASLCLYGNREELINIIQEFNKFGVKLDLCQDDGYFGILAIQNDHIDILKLLFDNDEGFVSNFDIKQTLLNVAALHGKIECVKFLLENGANPEPLKGTTSYSNYHEVKRIFDDWILTKKSMR